jgi:AraC-like DNA-binding protein
MFDAKQINELAFEYYAPLRRVRRYIEDNYHDYISLGKAAQIAGMERKYFSTFFHKKVGICFRYWLMGLRIGKAISLMETETEDHSITQIAFEIGFMDLTTFERAFKKCTGLTPTQFKKKVRRSSGNGYRNHDI